MKNGFDEACFLLLIAILEAVPQIRVITSDKIVYEIWSVLKNFESVSWCLFVINGNDNEYENIINDLLRTTKVKKSFHLFSKLGSEVFMILLKIIKIEVKIKC